MESVRLVNLKSFRDTGNVQIKPITILVGKNSSGKSSFLRLFSLLRQTVEARTRSSLLWYGQYVDYGSFEEAVMRGANKNEIVFQLTFRISEDMLNSYSSNSPRQRHIHPNLQHMETSIILTLKYEPKTKRTFVGKIELGMANDVAIIEMDESGKVLNFSVNELNLS